MTDRSTVWSYAGAAGSIISSLTLTQWGILIGIMTALGTFAFNVWARATEVRMRKREDARQEERMRRGDRRKSDYPVLFERRQPCEDCAFNPDRDEER